MRVDLLLTDRKCYTFEAYAAKQVMRCFENESILHHCLYLSDGMLQDYLLYIQNSPPDWTLSFVNLTPHHQPLCDVIELPHFLWMEGSFAHALHFLGSSYGKVGIHDYALCQKLSASNVTYLPLGIEKRTHSEKKAFDVVFFADLLDLSFLEKTWEELFSSIEITRIKNSIQKGCPLEAGPYFFYAEQYLKAEETMQIVQNFKEVRLDLFGEHAGNNWLLRLPNKVHLHTSLPFTEHFEVLAQSKILLATPSSPWYLPAIAAGCLPLEPCEKDITYYLNHPDERENKLAELQNTLLKQSWEKQTKQLLKYMQ